MQVLSQRLMTNDNVTIHMDIVAFYKVEDHLKALCNIEDRDATVSEFAQECLSISNSPILRSYRKVERLIRNIATDFGARPALSCSFAEALHDRDEAGWNVLAALCKLAADW